jgi:hypothetical protein
VLNVPPNPKNASRETSNLKKFAPISLARGFYLQQIHIMKRWALFTVLLYALALVLLTLPLGFIAFGNWGLKGGGWNLKDALALYVNWGYWLWLGVLLAGQVLLLLLPINLAERRLPARRPLKIPVIVTAFFLANLCFAGIFSLLCAIFTDRAFDLFDLSLLFHFGAGQNSANNNSGAGALCTMIFTVLVFWGIWALVFFRRCAGDAPDALLKRATNWLLRGSILELIIAVPSHVIVRRRDDCCAPIGTFWGIATGISVMLLCFGPGVFFLFVERCKKLQPKSGNADKPA